MPTATVILAPPGVMRAVRDVLHDWSAVGLLDPFFWVEPAGIGTHEVRSLLIDGGRLEGVDLVPALSDFGSERVQFCTLIPALTGADILDPELEWRLAQLIGAVTTPSLVRCTICRQGAAPDAAIDPCLEGWHNVVLAPEDSEGPSARRPLPLVETADPAQIGRDAAIGLAGLLGLWSGVEALPLDEVRLTPGRNARLFRSFYRRLSAEAAEHALRAKVLSTDRGLPRTRQQNGVSPYIDDMPDATASAANAWWAAHAWELRGPRQAPEKEKVRTIGVGETIRLFLSFMLAAIRNAPAAWLRRVKDEASVRVAQRVQLAVFGSAKSAYVVVVNGMTADGRPATWSDLSDAADAIDDVLTRLGAGSSSEGRADLSALWRDYVAGALTLADGAARVAAMPPALVGGVPAVARLIDDIVPGDSLTYRSLHGHLAADIDESEVRPFDALGVRNLNQQLDARAANPGLRIEVDRAKQDVRRWSETVRNSYAARIGVHLGEEILRTTAEIRSLLEWFKSSSDEEGGPGERSQRGLARWIQVTLSFLVVVVGGLAAILSVGLIGPLIFVVAAVVAVAAAVTSVVVRFFREQRELFRMLNRRRAAASAAAAAATNLRQAARDLRRQTDAYGRFLAWSDVLSAFLARPFGPVPDSKESVKQISGSLPNAVRLGTVEIDDDVVTHVAYDLRRDVFATGWMSGPWERLIADAGRRVGPDAEDQLGTPERLYAEPAANTVGEHSVLSRWADLVLAEGPSPEPGDAVWAQLLASFSGARAPQRGQLLQTICVTGQETGVRTDLASFLDGVQTRTDVASTAAFRGSPLTPHALLTLQSVKETVVAADPTGLGFAVAMVQFSESIPSYEFAFAPAHEAPDDGQRWAVPSSASSRQDGRTADAASGGADGPERAVPPAPFGGLTF